jgi:hypothetical protein
MGIGFTLVLLASMMVFAVPVAAGPYQDLAPALPNEWEGFPPTEGIQGSWFFDPAIIQVGPLAEAINGDLYAYVERAGVVTVPAVAASATITIPAGVTAVDLALNIDSTPITLAYGDTAAQIAAKIAAAVTDGLGVANATSAAAVITFTAAVPGAAGNVAVPMTDAVYYNGLTVPAATMAGGVTGVYQVDTVTPTLANNTLYSLGITPLGGSAVVFTYISDGSATVAEITAAFTALVNANLTLPVTAADTGVAFTLTADAYLTAAFIAADGGLGVLAVVITTPGVTQTTATITSTVPAAVTAVDLALNIDGIAITLAYTDNTATLVAAKIAATINASGARTVNVTASGANLTFTKIVAGVGGNGALAMTDDSYYLTHTVPAITLAGGLAATTTNAHDIFKSVDGGHTWSVSTIPFYYTGGTVVDMVCSSVSEDVLYVTDGNYVYKSVNGALSFSIVAEDSLELLLVGECGPTIIMGTTVSGGYITCLDVGYNASGDSLVFIGVTGTYQGGALGSANPLWGSVLYINEAGYPSEWIDLGLHCFHSPGTGISGNYDPYSVGCAPDFATSKKLYVAVSIADDLTLVGTTDPRTYVISSVGIDCSWSEVDQLFWNCDSTTPNNFQIFHASRFAFPSEYATTGNMFIGVAGATFGGDVYSAYDTTPQAQDALDLNVQGYTTGCIGFYDADICSLDIDENDALIAGALESWHFQSPTRTYYSADGGWTWTPSAKDPTGTWQTYVLFSGASAVAGTTGYDCAFSMSCGDVIGTYWNQISLISMSIDEVWDMSHAPGYVFDSSIMYVLTYDANVYPTVDIVSLLRWDGTYWERVHSSRYCDALGQVWVTLPLYDWVEVSPDFNDTGCVYMANTSFQMTRTVDQGCSWSVLAYPCAPLPTISAWIVVDEETVLASGSPVAAPTLEFIYKTDRHGTRPWGAVTVLNAVGAQTVNDGVDFDLSLPRGLESDVLFSDEAGQVFISQDMATTPFNEITDVVGPYTSFAGAVNTYVVFDPGYGTAGDPGENMIYAAGGTLVGRCALSSATPLAMQDWVYISVTGITSCDTFALYCASGIDAAGDTALYVSDTGYSGSATYPTVSGTINVRYNNLTATCDLTLPALCATTLSVVSGSGSFQTGEPLTILEWNLYCVTGDYQGVAGDILVQGLITHAMGWINISPLAPLAISCTACTPAGSAIEVISSGLTVCSAVTSTGLHPTGVWRTLNPMDPVFPYFTYNLIEWEFLEAGLTGPHELIHRQADTLGVWPDDLWLTQGSNMLWALDDYRQPADPTHDIWMWDDPLAAPVIQVAPADGALLATTMSATISWDPLDAATLYEYFIFSYCPTCPDNMVPFENLTTDLTCIVIDGLTPGTTYYWKVRVACDHPQVSKWSDLWTFNTALSSTELLCSPYCGEQDVILTPSFAWDAVIGATSYTIQVATDDAFTAIVTEGTSTVNAWMCDVTLDYDTSYYWQVQAVGANASSAWAPCIFHTAAEPVVVEPTPPVEVITNEITPTWIWVIIAIGGALTIAVVVLIVTTRRVP